MPLLRPSGRWIALKLIVLILLSLAARCPLEAAEDIAVKGGTIHVEFTPTPTPELHALARQWIENAARAVATFYGKFPATRSVLQIALVDGHEIADGHAFGYQGPLNTISVGRNAKKADFDDDWILPHEMLHLAFPDLEEKHHWLEEGLAVYVESVSRCRAGLLTPERAWGDLTEGFPDGEPAVGDRGLDHTHTWGRTYWGGALFCLRADVEIRRRTGNKFGLDHALRAILAAGGSIEHSWSIERVIATGDAATGVPVLRELYDETKAAPSPVDLPALYQKLGIILSHGKVTFDNAAPLAPLRKAIMGG